MKGDKPTLLDWVQFRMMIFDLCEFFAKSPAKISEAEFRQLYYQGQRAWREVQDWLDVWEKCMPDEDLVELDRLRRMILEEEDASIREGHRMLQRLFGKQNRASGKARESDA